HGERHGARRKAGSQPVPARARTEGHPGGPAERLRPCLAGQGRPLLDARPAHALGRPEEARGAGAMPSLLRRPPPLRADWNAHCAFGAVKFAPRQTLAVLKRLVPDGPTVALARPSPARPPG